MPYPDSKEFISYWKYIAYDDSWLDLYALCELFGTDKWRFDMYIITAIPRQATLLASFKYYFKCRVMCSSSFFFRYNPITGEFSCKSDNVILRRLGIVKYSKFPDRVFRLATYNMQSCKSSFADW